MPPKRKASSYLLNELPAKRSTRSTTAATTTLSDATQINVRAGTVVETASTPRTPRRVLNTYAKQGSARRRLQAAESLKENEKMEEAGRSEGKESDDELDMLSPTKKRTNKQPLLDSSPEVPLLAMRTRSGKLPETPAGKASKRGEKTKPIPRSQTPPPPKETTFTGPSDCSDQLTATSPRMKRHVSPKKPQATTPTRSSPRKKPLTTTNDDNVDLEVTQYSKTRGSALRSGQTPRKLPTGKRGAQESGASPSKKQKTPSNSSTLSIAAEDRPRSPDDKRPAQSSAPFKFDAVVVPLPSTPTKRRPQPISVSVSSLRDLRSDEPSFHNRSTFSETVGSIPLVIPEPARSDSTPSSTPTPPLSPTKKKGFTLSSPTRVPQVLPSHLHSCLNAQKRAIMWAAQHPPGIVNKDEDDDDEGPSTNTLADQQLTSLLSGTITRGEGNSCLVLGPRGSGKSRLVENCIASFADDKPLVLRLSGWTQHSDRLALREIAYQLSQQTGTSFLSQEDFTSGDAAIENEEAHSVLEGLTSTKTPQAAHLPALISLLPTLSRPTIVVLDGFDLFTLHPRQALLYCLLDTAQSCRATAGNKGLAVIGVTSRIDSVVHLEKRVKSRFSGRMIRTAPPRTLHAWETVVKAILSTDIDEFMGDQSIEEEVVAEWCGVWDAVVERFVEDVAVQTIWRDTFSVTRDVRMLTRMLLSVVLHLSPSSPSLSSAHFASAATVQRIRPRFPLLHTLPYPAICLLIASVHADTAGQPIFTFEMLHECFRDQVRTSTSAPVQVRGGSIGMVRCSRQVLMTAFEDLVAIRAFVPVSPHVPSVAKEFIKYRSVIEREDIKRAVDRMGQVNLRKWLTKAAQ